MMWYIELSIPRKIEMKEKDTHRKRKVGGRGKKRWGALENF